jgi:hypothetical protein
MEFEVICVACSTYGPFATKDEAGRFIRSLVHGHKALLFLGAHRTARLVQRLCERKRRQDEIRAMVVPIAKLAVVNDYDEINLADKLDRILRRNGKTASEAMAVADTLTTTAKESAATFPDY